MLDRRKCRADLAHFASRVPIPACPSVDADDAAPIPVMQSQQARHHVLMLEAMQRCLDKPYGRLMILAPPGSAKSTYCTVVGASWALRTPGARVLLVSHNSDVARMHARRARQLMSSPEYASIAQATVKPGHGGIEYFALTNGSEYVSGGLKSGWAGKRASVLVMDDIVASGLVARSEIEKASTADIIQNDLLSRLIPGAPVVLVNTRQAQDDPAGEILPEDWAGESGIIKGRDGMEWEVFCIQAECTSSTDPLGRKPGEMLWPEWFGEQHWAMFRKDRRTWATLFQQVPAPEDGIHFKRENFGVYTKAPSALTVVLASDFAVTEDGGDYTEIGVLGRAEDGVVYLLDWWRAQASSDVWCEQLINMIIEWAPVCLFGETGPITKAMEPRLRQRMIERDVACRTEWLKHITDHGQNKVAKAQPAIALCGMGRILFPKAAWVGELQNQLLFFPNGKRDDGVDTLAIGVRGLDTLGNSSSSKLDFTTSAARGRIFA
jgi:predicted phage terminase large subunit-like protein